MSFFKASKILGFIRLMRPLNCTMFGMAVIIGFLIIAPSELFTKLTTVILGFSLAWLLSASSMVLNDYFDREIDKLNNPQKPIPSGLITQKEALCLASLLGIAGLIIALRTGFLGFTIAVVFYAIAILYDAIGKKLNLLGNFMVSSCVAIPFLFGSLLAKLQIGLLPILFAILAFLSNTGREIVKGIADIKGDKMRGANTLPIVIGSKKSAIVAVSFFVLAVALSFLPPSLNLVSFAYLPIVSVVDGGFLVSSVLLLRDFSSENALRVKNQVIIWMLIGILAFLVGGVLR